MMKLTKNIVFLLLLGLLLQGCVPSEEEKEAASDAFNPDDVKLGELGEGCRRDRYQTDEKYITRKLDIVIVPDTSGSIRQERGKIADGFDAFVDVLPAEVDYQVSVILGHGSKSKWSGELYMKDPDSGEPAILSSHKYTTDEIKSYLKTKIQYPKVDGYGDGGELSLYSLNKALTENYQDIQDSGFFREDAATVVIFVADENDVCAEYPDGVTPVPDPQGAEGRSYRKDCFKGVPNGVVASGRGFKEEDYTRAITPDSVLEKLQDRVGDRPLIVGGVVYNNPSTIPLTGENELGYGHLETIDKAGGITVDLATGNYGNGLTRLGKMAMASIKPESEFNLKYKNVKEDTIKVLQDGDIINHTYVPELNQVHISKNRPALSTIDVEYCKHEETQVQENLDLVAGGRTACALHKDGSVHCWGDNTYGQLGQGHTENLGDDELLSTVSPIPFTNKVKQLSSGFNHTCALFEEGNIKCWGLNNEGQLGYGDIENRGDNETLESLSDVNIGGTAKAVYTGTNHSCAIRSDNSIVCWGSNSFGELGYGHTERIGDDEDPIDAGTVNIGGGAIQMDISTMSRHTCALLEDRSVTCWGRNDTGQLGLGHTENIGDDEEPINAPLVDLGSDRSAMMITTGRHHTCAVLDNSELLCWGDNTQAGALGIGEMAIYGDNESPSAAPIVPVGESVKNVSAGMSLTCATSEASNVKCWGEARFGSLGKAYAENIGDDELASSILFIDLGELKAQEVETGVFHACALTETESKIICWGLNSTGQLGYGDTQNTDSGFLPADRGPIDFGI